jgi:hypothetical protein
MKRIPLVSLAFGTNVSSPPKEAKGPIVEDLRVRRKYYFVKRMGVEVFLLGAIAFASLKECKV